MILKRIITKLKKYRYFKSLSASSLVDIPDDIEVHYGEEVDFKGAAYIGSGAFIDARGGVEIGNNVIIAPRVAIFSYNHDFKNTGWVPYSPNIDKKKVIICDDCWLGFGVILTAGTIIGKRSIVGAGSVLRGMYPENSIIAGNPAEVVGETPSKNIDAKEYQVIMSNLKRWG
jgi:acetyltransferase-like isoleucine patch superfamily enzyme